MALQARAEATRRRILDSAVDLFDEFGYGDTGLADILQKAKVSKGAFYYHFDSKEAVASAIIEDYGRRSREAILDGVDPAAPQLERMIVANSISVGLLKSDKAARVGNQLAQALHQITRVGAPTYQRWTVNFIADLTEALNEIGIREGMEPAEIAEPTWAALLGSHLLASAFGDDPYTRQANVWRNLVRLTLREESQAHYLDLLERLTKGLQTVG